MSCGSMICVLCRDSTHVYNNISQTSLLEFNSLNMCKQIALFPGSSQFFNDARRKTAKPGIQFHMTNANACTSQTKLGKCHFPELHVKFILSTASSVDVYQQMATASIERARWLTISALPMFLYYSRQTMILRHTTLGWKELLYRMGDIQVKKHCYPRFHGIPT